MGYSCRFVDSTQEWNVRFAKERVLANCRKENEENSSAERTERMAS